MLRRDVTLRKVILICGRTDMRKGIDGLMSVVRLNYGLDPIEKGTLFLFCGAKKSRIKGLIYEGDGFCLITKRLNTGRYSWPNSPGEARKLTMEEYDRLMGIFDIDSIR